MYVENKADGLGRIGLVEVSKSRRSYYYQGRCLQKTKSGYKYNCIDADTGESFWVSGPHRDGRDRLYGGIVAIDEDAREEYWVTVRKMPEKRQLTQYRPTSHGRTDGRHLLMSGLLYSCLRSTARCEGGSSQEPAHGAP